MKNRKLLIVILAVLLIAIVLLSAQVYRTRNQTKEQTEPAATEELLSDPTEEPVSSGEDPLMAPDFTVRSMDGEDVSLTDLLALGKPVVLNFWATWCGPCRMEMPAFDAAFALYGQDVSFMMVNLTDGRDTEEQVRSFLEETGYRFPVYLDTELDAANTYDLYSIPMTVFIYSDGCLASTRIGSMSEDDLYNNLYTIMDVQ